MIKANANCSTPNLAELQSFKRCQKGKENIRFCFSYYTQAFISYSPAQWTDHSVFIDFVLRCFLNILSHRTSRTFWGITSATFEIQIVDGIIKGARERFQRYHICCRDPNIMYHSFSGLNNGTDGLLA